MVGDFRRGHLEVSWRSPSEGHMSSSPYSVALDRKHRGNSAVAIITVATRDWPSYSCSVSRRRYPKVARRHYTTTPDHEDKMCYECEETQDVAVRTNAVVVMIMRLLLIKSLAFNTLITTYAVVKW
ncbi:uncharacterized protein AB9W97_012903 isoform 2-T2 [Spinachia spinachia]